MSSAQLSRPASDGGLLRRLNIDIDGKRVAALRPGASVDVELTPGQHTMLGQMDWCKTTVDLMLPDSGTLKVIVRMPVSASSLWDTFFRPSKVIQITVL